MRSRRITILSSQENLVWISMNEIIPWIEKSWERWAREVKIESRLIYVEKAELPEVMAEIMKSDLVIMTCFTTRLAGMIHIARERLKLSFKLAIYLHNQATIGLWPFYEWKMGDSLHSGDIFVGSCNRDRTTMELNFQNANTMIHPFSYDKIPNSRPVLPVTPQLRLVFIGRISPQKNLHTLMWSLSLLEKLAPTLGWSLDLFGKEDHLGAPLMGIENDHYQLELEELVRKLHLEKKVRFRGFMDREEIQTEMSRTRCAFIVPSLHSDENFGMAALRCLSQGHLAILSAWGGHSDYKDHFEDALELVPVYEGTSGPWISATELAQSIMKASAIPKLREVETPSYYLSKDIIHSLEKVFESAASNGSPLKRTPLAERVHQNRTRFLEMEKKEKGEEVRVLKGGRIFENFEDQDSFEYFRAYGMKKLQAPKATPEIEAPWVVREGNELRIEDPMKGTSVSELGAGNEEWLRSRGCRVSLRG